MINRFHKMHGLGNDFVVIDARVEALDMTANRARAIADRRLGIGCDQIVLIEQSSIADMRLRFFNADGSEVGACGNGTRAAALYIGKPVKFETGGGILSATIEGTDASVDMGEPRFDWDQIPLSYAMDTLNMPVGWDDLTSVSAVNVGNPHIVLFCEGSDSDVRDKAFTLGPQIETDPLFPERVNANFARVDTPTAISLWTWERGAGHTQACGTGACATAVAAIRTKRATGPVTVSQPGGQVVIDWSTGGNITMTGPATHVYSGETDWSLFGE
jgi:diaminopimelate epimerase